MLQRIERYEDDTQFEQLATQNPYGFLPLCRAYQQTKEKWGTDFIVIDDSFHESFVITMAKEIQLIDITRFAISCKTTSMIDILSEFQKYGFRPQKTIMLEYEAHDGMLFEKTAILMVSTPQKEKKEGRKPRLLLEMHYLEDAIKHYEALQRRFITQHNGRACRRVKMALGALKQQLERNRELLA